MKEKEGLVTVDAMYSKVGRDLRVEDGVVGVDTGEAEIGDLAPPPLVEEHVVRL